MFSSNFIFFRVHNVWSQQDSQKPRVQINFSKLYHKKIYDKNLLVSVSLEGPHAVDCWKMQFPM